MEQKIKQDSIRIGENIRRVRLAQHIKQTQLVQLLQLEGINMTRETLVKIETPCTPPMTNYSGNHNQLKK